MNTSPGPLKAVRQGAKSQRSVQSFNRRALELRQARHSCQHLYMHGSLTPAATLPTSLHLRCGSSVLCLCSCLGVESHDRRRGPQVDQWEVWSHMALSNRHLPTEGLWGTTQIEVRGDGIYATQVVVLCHWIMVALVFRLWML